MLNFFHQGSNFSFAVLPFCRSLVDDQPEYLLKNPVLQTERQTMRKEGW